MVDPDGTPRIVGFSSSRMISRPDLWSEGDAAGFFRGTAPELIRPHKPGGNCVVKITKASDMYALGMLTLQVGGFHRNLRLQKLTMNLQILSGRDPFVGDLDVTVIHRVLRGDRPSRPHHPGLSDRVWKMVEACWHDRPSRRPTAGQVVALIEAEWDSSVLKRPIQLLASPSQITFSPFLPCHL